MTIEQYMEQAITNLKKHNSPEIALADWSLGLGGEFGEVAEVIIRFREMQEEGIKPDASDLMDLAKEIGDVVWYVCALAKHLNIPVDQLGDFGISRRCPGDIFTQITVTQVLIGKILEQSKHCIAHKEELNKEDLGEILRHILEYLNGTANEYRMRLEDIAALNVAKLAHRYEKKFTATASANRHDKEKKFEQTEVYTEIKTRLIG